MMTEVKAITLPIERSISPEITSTGSPRPPSRPSTLITLAAVSRFCSVRKNGELTQMRTKTTTRTRHEPLTLQLLDEAPPRGQPPARRRFAPLQPPLLQGQPPSRLARRRATAARDAVFQLAAQYAHLPHLWAPPGTSLPSARRLAPRRSAHPARRFSSLAVQERGLGGDLVACDVGHLRDLHAVH